MIMQEDFLNEYSIIEILGLELNETEKNNYLNKITEDTTKKALYRLYKDGYIKKELFNKLEPSISSKKDDHDITDDVIHIKDELIEYLNREVNEHKKISLLKQILDFLKHLKSKKIQDQEVYEITTQLTDSIKNRTGNFNELLKKYNQLKIHYEYKSSV